jgi:hypothetical protein
VTENIEQTKTKKFTDSGLTLTISNCYIVKSFGLYGSSQSIRSVLENLEFIEFKTTQDVIFKLDGDWIRNSMVLRKLQVKYSDNYFSLAWLLRLLFFYEESSLIFHLKENKLNRECKLLYSIPILHKEESQSMCHGYNEESIENAVKMTIHHTLDTYDSTKIRFPKEFRMLPKLVCIECRDLSGNMILPIKSIDVLNKNLSVMHFKKSMLVHDKISHNIKNINAPLYTISVSPSPFNAKILTWATIEWMEELQINIKKSFRDKEFILKVYFVSSNVVAIERGRNLFKHE